MSYMLLMELSFCQSGDDFGRNNRTMCVITHIESSSLVVFSFGADNLFAFLKTVLICLYPACLSSVLRQE